MAETAEIVLPTRRAVIERVNPKRMVIYSKPKAGKTTAIAGLDDCLILDFEDGAGFVSAMKINIDNLSKLRQVGTQILNQGRPYKYIAVDTVTALEDMARVLALKLYKATPIGKNYEGENVLTLPNGAGYGYLREAMDYLLNYIDTLADNIILLGHLKDKQIEIKGKEVIAADIDLTGKIRNIVCSKADAIGYLSRSNGQTLLNFNTKDEITCGARPEHLRNKEIILAETLEDGSYNTYWNRIYL